MKPTKSLDALRSERLTPNSVDPAAESWVSVGIGLCAVFWTALVIFLAVALLAGCTPCATQCQDKACMSQCSVFRW